MIAWIQGSVIEKRVPKVVLNVNGIGYELEASLNTFDILPGIGEEATLFTHFVVREDAQQLYGFAKAGERELFRALIRINGVGPKMALTILSSIQPSEFVQCVQENNTARLVKLPGVGQKTAERLLLEMRGRLKDWPVNFADPNTSDQAPAAITQHQIEQEALSALIALGYKPQMATRAIMAIDTAGLSSEAIIRLALQGATA